MVMPIEHIPDWEQRLARQDAFWHREIIDRPVVLFTFSQPNPAYPYPPDKGWAAPRERWMDVQYQAERALSCAMNTYWGGDALPHADPNLGPEVFSAFFGTELEYGETTAWSTPNLHDWAEVDAINFSEDNRYWKKIIELTDAFLEIGKGKFYTGLTDLHPGGDALVAFRDPLYLNMDMLEADAEVKVLLRYITDVCLKVYDFYHDKLTAAGQAITCWADIVSTRRWYVASNDFSCMISKEMFDDIFLPGIAEECRHLEASIYHLDGPNALQHLDSLLAIPELNAIQWVYGEGNGRASDWLPVYQRCQEAGKGIQIVGMHADELELFMAELKPQGVWIRMNGGVESPEHGEAILQRVAQWR